MKYQALIFDLFGTLVYSFSAREYQQVIKKMAGMVRLRKPSGGCGLIPWMKL